MSSTPTPTHPPTRPAGRRRFAVLAVASLLLTAGAIVGTPSAASASDVDQPLGRAEILERAEWWYQASNGDPGFGRQVDATRPGPEGTPYRTDCSGLVALAWHTSSQPGTAYLHTLAHPIAYEELLPGDILLAQKDAGHTYGHVAIFEAWADDAHTTYLAYDFGGGGPGGRMEHRTYAIDRPGDSRTYLAYRYDQVVD